MIEFQIEYAAKLFVSDVEEARRWLEQTLGAKNEVNSRAIYIGGVAYKIEKGPLVDPNLIQIAISVRHEDFNQFLNHLVNAGCEIISGQESDNKDRGYRILKAPVGFGIHLAWRTVKFTTC